MQFIIHIYFIFRVPRRYVRLFCFFLLRQFFLYLQLQGTPLLCFLIFFLFFFEGGANVFSVSYFLEVILFLLFREHYFSSSYNLVRVIQLSWQFAYLRTIFFFFSSSHWLLAGKRSHHEHRYKVHPVS